jgi:Cupin domain
MRKINPKIKYCTSSIDGKCFYLVDHVRIPPDEQIAFHQHEQLEISYVIRGSGTRIIGNTMEPFSQGEVVFIPSNIPHCWSFDSFDTYADGTASRLHIKNSAVPGRDRFDTNDTIEGSATDESFTVRIRDGTVRKHL